MSEGTRRRLAAIAAAEVAGCSHLVGADEEGKLNALRSHRWRLIDWLIADHRGGVTITVGYSLSLKFSSVVAAVRYSVVIRHSTGEIAA